MIEFKTIDDFTFDDCVKSIERRKSEGLTPEEELLERYNTLLETLKSEEERDYQSVKTIDGLNRFIKKYSALPGATKYQPQYLKEAKQELPRLKQTLKKRKKTRIYCFLIGVVGIVVGLIPMWFLPFIAASSLSAICTEFGNSADWGPIGFLIFASITLFLFYMYFKKKAINKLKYAFFFLGITLACIPVMCFTCTHNVEYRSYIPSNGRANDFGILHWNYYDIHDGGGFGLVDNFGQSIIGGFHDCFFFTSNHIISILQKKQILIVCSYNYNGHMDSILELEISNNTNSIKLRDVITQHFGIVSQYWKGNALKGITSNDVILSTSSETNIWESEELFDMPVIIKTEDDSLEDDSLEDDSLEYDSLECDTMECDTMPADDVDFSEIK